MSLSGFLAWAKQVAAIFIAGILINLGLNALVDLLVWLFDLPPIPYGGPYPD